MSFVNLNCGVKAQSWVFPFCFNIRSMTEVMNTREPVMEEFALSQTPEEEGGPSSQVTLEKLESIPGCFWKAI